MINTATVIGTRGTITLTDAFRSDLADGVGTVLVDTGGQVRTIRVPGDQYADQIRAFAGAVTDRRTGEAHRELSRRTARTLDRIARAAGLA
jgi:predicted dehydrogenase